MVGADLERPSEGIAAWLWPWLTLCALLVAALALMARESAAGVTLGLGSAPLLGVVALLAAGIATAASLGQLVARRRQEGMLFRVLLTAFAATLLGLAWLLEYRVVESSRVEIAGEYGDYTGMLYVPRGEGPYAAALVLPSAEGADAREAKLLARYMAERGVVALAVDSPLAPGALEDAAPLFARLVEVPEVDEVRSGLVSIGEAASEAIRALDLATFLVVAGVEAEPGHGHWGDVHVPVLLLAGGREDTAAGETRLDEVASQLTPMTQAETDALLLDDGDRKLRRSPLSFARGYPRVVPGWIHLIFRLPGEPLPEGLVET